MDFLNGLISLLTLLHSERPKLYAILAFLSAIGLKEISHSQKTGVSSFPIQEGLLEFATRSELFPL